MKNMNIYERENWPVNPYTSSVLTFCNNAVKIMSNTEPNRLFGFSLSAHMCLQKNSTYTMRDVINASHYKSNWIPGAALLKFDRTLISKEHFDRIAYEIMECYMEEERENVAKGLYIYKEGETFTKEFDNEKNFSIEMKTEFKAKRPDLFN